MDKVIPYGRQYIDQEDIDAVVEVLRGDWLTQGPKVEEFERAVAEYCGARYAIAFNSGTSALHGAMYAAGVGPGDEVLTAPITFAASANAAVYLGARPRFVDIDISTYCIHIDKIEASISERTRAIVPVDYAGYPLDIETVNDIARRHGLVVIEDAAHALGARRATAGRPAAGQPLGSQADMTILSFHPVKHITTGEGGMVLTDQVEFYKKMMVFRTHGITKDPGSMQEDHGPWYYEMQDLGYNYRLTDIQSTLGRSQLKKLEGFVAQRNRLAERYNEALAGTSWIQTPPPAPAGSRHAYHLYPILVSPEMDRRKVFDYLRGKGIGVQVHYIPVHLHPYYRRCFGCRPGDFPVSEGFYAREISLPMFPGLSLADQDRVVETLINF
ncbi:MAG: UDP-4-amino-4,6-dideoxy-N-acetyl-beta-L-altrosamine transaminase [Firmicutes bacterium]|nr:UDP-4-amino-4,6-dideoxy-N-acetyl-beta-L-altrosamine transaminase [Bacillota bacterium]